MVILRSNSPDDNPIPEKRCIEWEKIRSDYETGNLSFRQLAAKYGISKTYILEKRDKEQWVRPAQRPSERLASHWPAIRADYEAGGASLRQLAMKYGVSKSGILERRDKEAWAKPAVNQVHSKQSDSRKRNVQGNHTPKQVQEQLKRQKCRCYYCEAKFEQRYIYHVEHTFPLSRANGDDPINNIDYIVLACPSCNLSKGNKYPWEWPEGGKLL